MKQAGSTTRKSRLSSSSRCWSSKVLIALFLSPPPLYFYFCAFVSQVRVLHCTHVHNAMLIRALGTIPVLLAGLAISQTVAIMNYIARKAGKHMEGETDVAFANSQMFIAEAEDLYSGLQKHFPTAYRANGCSAEDKAAYWADIVPKHFGYVSARTLTAHRFFRARRR